MPQLDVYRQQQTAQNELRVVRNAQPSAAAAEVVGETITAFGELGMRIQEARAEQEAANLEIEAKRRYDAAYRELEADPDAEDQFESRLIEKSREIQNELLGKVKSKPVRDAFDLRLKGIESAYVLDGRDLSRKRTIENIKAGVIGRLASLEDTAKDMSVMFEDKDRPDLRSFVNERDVIMAEINSMARGGWIGKDEAAQFKVKIDDLAKKADSDRILNEIDNRLDAGESAAAEEYFKMNYARILPEAAERVESVLETKTLESRAITKADEFWAKSGGDYGAAIAEAAKITNPDERLAVESRIAQLENQRTAAEEVNDKRSLAAGMEYITTGRSIPASVMRDASPKVRDILQTEVRTRQMWDQQMANATAEGRALMNQTSKGNYYRLKAQLADPQLAAAGFNAILADPALSDLYNNMSPDEQGQFFNDAMAAQSTGGVPADKTLKAYKDVMALVGTSLPEGLTAKTFGTTFKGAGEGDPGVERVSENRKKSKAAIELEGVMMRLVGEELERTGGAPIDQDRAKQLAALALAEAGTDPKTGQTKYPVSPEIASGVIAADARTQIITFRRDYPAVWSKATQIVRSQYPDASDALVLEEARKLQAGIMAKQAVDTVTNFFSKPEGN